ANVQAFQTAFDKFGRTVERLGIGPLVPNQCEITYVNPFPTRSDRPWSEIFRTFAGLPSVKDLRAPEDGQFVLRYVIENGGGQPAGRLIALAQPAWKADGTKVMQFNLTARGAPATPD